MKVAVVGGGIAGLTAARTLNAAGHEAVVFERARRPGGRMATRRIDGARLDHGAQFFTVRTDEMAASVREWQADGKVREWCRGFSATGDGYPRYVADGGMNALAQHVARGLDVRCESLVFSLHHSPAPHAWEVKLDDGTVSRHDALVITCPLPQTFSLLVTAEVAMPEALWRTDYDRTLTLLAVLDADSAVPPPGGVQGVGPFTFVGDNRAKGISAVPALTVHADPTWSAEHWNDDAASCHRALVDAAAPFVGRARIVTSQVKRWRFATPQAIWPEWHWSPEEHPSLAVAGDAFAGPRVEGAVLSGLAAAAALMAG
ncbi:MAG: FAD-dependent oxidoreductase [Actinobacteria bacterium]|nr:FAD-dependent oxidoreductase [Actinomycetota bacterium]